MRPGPYLQIAITAALAVAGATIFGSWWLQGSALATRLNFVMERKTAARIAEGKAVIMSAQLDVSMLRWQLAHRITRDPDAAVFGSSHSLGVSGRMVGADHSMNFSIPGSALADHFATAGILDARGIHSPRMVIFVDPWLFDRGADFGGWHLQADAVIHLETVLSATPPRPEAIFTGNRGVLARSRRPLFSLEPILRMVDGAAAEFLLQARLAPPGQEGPHILARDGSLPPSDSSQAPATAAVEALALRQFGENPDRHRYGTFERFDPQLWDYFDRWVQYYRRQGSEVWLVLSPYHPAIYPRILRSPGNQLKAVEARLREYSRRTGIPLVGSYDPARAGVTADLFYDGDHLREEGLQRLLAPISRAPAVPAHRP